MTGPLKLHWDQVTAGERGSDLDEALLPIRKLNHGAIWRYGQAGDLPGVRDTIDRDGVLKIAKASRGKRAIIFTHKPPSPENIAIIKEAAAEGLNINLSADSVERADELADLNLPVAVVLNSDYARKKGETLSDYRRRAKELANYTPKGRKIAVCPATYTDVSCTQCGVCADGERKGVIIGFPAHGTQKKRVDEIAGHAGKRQNNERRQGDYI
ncbi:MAG: hypothetical protein EOQ53_20065 [Mesorhizobium sp.]|nr:MAG: hypothetical protein EOQ53_20065 [Mesorhizobium sp.]